MTSPMDFAVARLAPLLLLLIALSPTAGAEALARIKESGVMQFAVYDNFPPFSFKDGGRGVGLDIELGKAIAEELGVVGAAKLVGADENMEDDLRNNVWKGHYIGGGVVDVMLHVPVDEEFAEENDRVVIIAPYYREQIVLALPKSLARPGFDMSVFFDRKIGVELDTLADFYLLGAYQGRIRDNVVHFRSITEAAKALRDGEISGVLAPRGEIEGALRNDRDRFTIAPTRLHGLRQSGWDVGMAIKVGNQELVAAVSAAVDRLHDSGRIEQMFTEHGLTYQKPSIMRKPR